MTGFSDKSDKIMLMTRSDTALNWLTVAVTVVGETLQLQILSLLDHTEPKHW